MALAAHAVERDEQARLQEYALRALDGPRPTAQIAKAWIAARDPAEPLSFQNVCNALGLEPNALRAALLS